MKLATPFIQLPLRFDARVLAGEIHALGEEAWRPHPQGFPGNSMLPLVAVHGDAANEAFAGPMQPTPELQRCPYLGQVLRAPGVTIGRTRLMRLSGHAEVTRHADQAITQLRITAWRSNASLRRCGRWRVAWYSTTSCRCSRC